MSIRTKLFYTSIKLIKLKNKVSQMFLTPSRVKTFSFPNYLKKYKYNQTLIDNRNVITFNADSKNQHIIFFHGGAYSSEVLSGHWWMIEQLLKKTKFKLTFIDYPLSPEHTITQIHKSVIKIYTQLAEDNPNDTFYFVGDSAGGGLSLSLAQTLRDMRHPILPKKTLLLSPWLDATMRNSKIEALESKDLVLSKKVLITIAKRLSGDLPITNPILSPLFGDVNDLTDVAIFIGERDILLPDCQLLKIKIEKSNTKLWYKEYDNMIHDWALFPIPERKNLMSDVSNYLLKI